MNENDVIAVLCGTAVALISALIAAPQWMLYLIFIGLVIGIMFGILGMLRMSHHFNVVLVAKSNAQCIRSSEEILKMKACIKELVREPTEPKRLPAVFGRMIDDSLQRLIDLTLRDYVAAWNTEQGFGSSDELTQDVKEDVWKVVQNVQERLSKVDGTKLLCIDFVNRITQHFELIRTRKQNLLRGRSPNTGLLPHLTNSDTEKDYLRQIMSALLVLLFPLPYSASEPIKHMLRELLTCKVLFPAIETVTEPDFINLKLLSLIQETQPNIDSQRDNTHKRPETYQDLTELIQNSNDIEVLKHIRYDLVREITTPSNTELSESGQMKTFTNQLLHAKSSCEKRLHALGWMGYPVEEAMEANSVVGGEPVPILLVLNSIQGQKYFRDYLKSVDSPDLVGCWTACEKLRQSHSFNWHVLGAEIYYTYIKAPSATIKPDKTVCKRMETFLLGDSCGPEVFYELQDSLFQTLSEELYPSFLFTDLYQEMQTALNVIYNEEEDSAEDTVIDAASNAEVEGMTDQSNYSRRKLLLQERLKNKVQALQALRTSLKPESRVLTQLEAEVEGLEGEIRQLEAHVMRTEAWGEHLGQWRAVVQSAEMSEDKECPQFVLVVHILEDDKDSESISTGWVVLRKLQDFQDLNQKLCQLSSDVKHLELPTQSLKFRLGKTTVKNALEKAKIQVQKYLQFVLEDERLNQSEALYSFLSPSSEHLKQLPSLVPKKSKFSFATLIQSTWDQNISVTLSPVPKEPADPVSLLSDESVEESRYPSDSKDAIAEPLYALLNELCDLNKTVKWIRRSLITAFQHTYNRSINRTVRAVITDILSEHNVYSYIELFVKSWWPNGQLTTSPLIRTCEEKMKTREEARLRLLNNIPAILCNLMGQQNARQAATKVFEALQDPLLNKHLLYMFVDILLYEVCPELKGQ